MLHSKHGKPVASVQFFVMWFAMLSSQELIERARDGEIIGGGHRQVALLVSRYDDFEIAIRKAIEPVEDWFDMRGEEGDPYPIVDAVADTAKMLAEERQDLLRCRAMLQKMYKEMELAWSREAPKREEVHAWGRSIRELLVMRLRDSGCSRLDECESTTHFVAIDADGIELMESPTEESKETLVDRAILRSRGLRDQLDAIEFDLIASLDLDPSDTFVLDEISNLIHGDGRRDKVLELLA